MFGIIIDAAPNGENNKVLVSSNVKLLQLLISEDPTFSIVYHNKWWKMKKENDKRAKYPWHN